MSVAAFCRRRGFSLPLRHLPPGGVPLPVGDMLAAAGTALGSSWQAAGVFGRPPTASTAGCDALGALGLALHMVTGCRHAFALGTGRAALSVTLCAMRRLAPERDVVLLPAYTSYSVAAAAVHAGLRVRLYDLDPFTLAPRMEDVATQMDGRVLAAVACHLFGYPVPTAALRSLCQGYGARLVDDAAQAMGARSADGLAGTTGDAGLFSLARGKNITAVDGGLVIMHDDALAASLATLAPWAVLPGVPGVPSVPGGEDNAGAPAMASATASATAPATAPAMAFATASGPVHGPVPGPVPPVSCFVSAHASDVLCAPAESLAATVARDMSLLARAVAQRLFQNPVLYWLPASLPFLGIGTSRFDCHFAVAPLRPLQATLAARAMGRLDAINAARSGVAAALEQRLERVPGVRTLDVQPGAVPVHLRLPVLPAACEWPGDTVPEAPRLGLVRSYPLSLQDLAAQTPSLAAHLLPGPDCPTARWLAATLLTLPTHAGVTHADMDAMADSLAVATPGVGLDGVSGVAVCRSSATGSGCRTGAVGQVCGGAR